MSQHAAAIEWQRAVNALDSATYSRNHVATLAGGQQLKVSASVDYKGDPQCADPEQLVVSSLASCHMLFFLAIADAQGFRVEHYHDTPTGYLEKGERGLALTRIALSPRVTFGGEKLPDAATVERMHARAHKSCFIANSLTAKVTLDLGPDVAG